MESVLNNPLFVPIVVTCCLILLVPLVAGYLSLVERKVLADFQVRLGPMRVGPHGLLQPIADALKLVLKEDIIPANADKLIFWLAPCVSTFTALTAFSVLPFSRSIYVADVNIGILVVTAMSAVGILGIILGGWSSNSHYPLLGALRSAAQLVSYEVAMGFALVSGLMAAGTLSMQGIVRTQLERGIWLVFDNYGFMVVAFVLFLIAATAETNRAPFDLPEAESELVAGFHTEYSGMRFATFFLAEFSASFFIAALAVTLFLGGWGLWGIDVWAAKALLGWDISNPVIAPLLMKLCWFGIFLVKSFAVLWVLMWVKWTMPRLRIDQVLNFGWKILLPVGLLNLLVVSMIGLYLHPAENQKIIIPTAARSAVIELGKLPVHIEVER
jgi:NADH-quinone oxidoreductase subunit H